MKLTAMAKQPAAAATAAVAPQLMTPE